MFVVASLLRRLSAAFARFVTDSIHLFISHSSYFLLVFHDLFSDSMPRLEERNAAQSNRFSCFASFRFSCLLASLSLPSVSGGEL